MPEMQYVTSSNVEAVGYDPTLRELHVRFLNGGTYIYYEVEEFQFLDMTSGISVGTYLNQIIKPNHRVEKI